MRHGWLLALLLLPGCLLRGELGDEGNHYFHTAYACDTCDLTRSVALGDTVTVRVSIGSCEGADFRAVGAIAIVSIEDPDPDADCATRVRVRGVARGAGTLLVNTPSGLNDRFGMVVRSPAVVTLAEDDGWAGRTQARAVELERGDLWLGALRVSDAEGRPLLVDRSRITWTTSNPAVAHVEEQYPGFVFANGPGEATVSVQYRGDVASVEVRVHE